MNTTLFFNARIIQQSDFETDEWLKKKEKSMFKKCIYNYILITTVYMFTRL